MENTKKNLDTRNRVDLPLENIKNEFSNLFNVNLMSNVPKQTQSISELDNLLKNHDKNLEKIKINKSVIENIVYDLPNNTSKGQSCISNEQIKLSNCDRNISRRFQHSPNVPTN